MSFCVGGKKSLDMTSFCMSTTKTKAKHDVCALPVSGEEEGGKNEGEKKGRMEELYANGFYKLSRACCRDTVYI